MEAAGKRDDIEMISLLANYMDLFAYDAKYHKFCYSQYISRRNIASKIRMTNNDDQMPNKTFLQIENYVREHILQNQEKITLGVLLKQYNSVAESFGQTSTKSYRLKQMLKRKFGKEIQFISRRGKADIIYNRYSAAT